MGVLKGLLRLVILWLPSTAKQLASRLKAKDQHRVPLSVTDSPFQWKSCFEENPFHDSLSLGCGPMGFWRRVLS